MSRAVLLAPTGFSGAGEPLTELVIDWLAALIRLGEPAHEEVSFSASAGFLCREDD